MADQKKFSDLNRIPAEALSDVHTWQLPEVSAGNKILPSPEKEAREKKEAEQETNLADSETIEDVEFPISTGPSITADQLEKITAEAEAQGRAQGYQDGLNKGLEEGRELGHAEGVKAGQEEISQAVSHLLEVSQMLRSPIEEQYLQLQRQLEQTVLTLTRGIVRRELITDSSHILSVVQEAISALPIGSDHVKLFLNPDDLAQIETYAQTQQLNWQFFSDEQLLPGGCRIESAQSLVDFSVESSTERILQQYLDGQLGTETSNAPEDEFIPGQLEGDWQSELPDANESFSLETDRVIRSDLKDLDDSERDGDVDERT